MIIDILKQNNRRNRRNALRTWIISAAYRTDVQDPTTPTQDKRIWSEWSLTGDVYAVVTSTSPFDALMDYLRSRPDLRDEAKTQWSYDKQPKFMAGQRVWAVIGLEGFATAQRFMQHREAKEIGEGQSSVRFITVY